EEQVQAAPFEGGGEVAGVVAGQNQVRGYLGGEGADLGYGHLELGQCLQQHGLQRLVGTVHLVDQQHRRIGGADRLQQRASCQEPLGEEHALLRADAVDGRLEVGGVGDDLPD